MRRLNSNLSDKSNENWKTPYLDVIAVGTIQFLLSILIFSYGVFLMQFVLREFCDLETSLWTAIAYVTASKITNPWVNSYCKHLDTIRHKVHKRNVIVTVIVLFIDLLTASLFHTPQTQIIFYGVFGGILSSIIHVHLKYVTAEVFKSQTPIFDILTQIMKPFVLIFMPHVVLSLTNIYGVAHTQLILSAAILNIIPACLLIRKKKYKRTKLCKFQTIDRLSIEMTDLNPKSPTVEDSSSSDEDDEIEEVEKIESDVSEPNSPEPTTNNVQKYFFENFGVKILPNIPEEDETDEDDDINAISTKRLSRISAILQELNENNPKNLNLSHTNLFQPDEIVENIEPEHDDRKYSSEVVPKKSRCFSITSDTKFEWKLKKNQLKSFLYKNFVRSVPTTLSTIHFYPVLISNSITTLLSTIIFATAPYFMFWRNGQKTNYPTTPEEATFLLTIIGFSWLFYLAAYPIFSSLSTSRIKILFILGISILGSSLFIAHKFSYDNFTLFSLTFGLGHGIITYTEKAAYENFSGEDRWKMIHGALEICTGYIVILVYLVIYFNSYLKLHDFISYAYWLYVFDVTLWIIAYVVKLIVIRVKGARRYNVQRYPDYDF